MADRISLDADDMSDPRARTGAPAGLAREAEPAIFIVSYPKSGRTWLRALVGKYLSLKHGLPESAMLETDRLTRAAGLPLAVFTHDGSEMLSGTHYSAVAGSKDRYKGKKVLFISRDIRDTLVSAYFQALKRIGVFSGTISKFVRSDHFGAKKIVAFYDSWHRNYHVPEAFMLVRYEELHRDPENTVARVLEFLGESPVRRDLVKASVEYCSFDNLRQAEREDRFQSSILRPGSAADPQSYKLREGKIGGYVRYLSREDIEYTGEEIRRAGLVEAGMPDIRNDQSGI